MFELPPIPTWQGLHPIIIHFSIGLLFVVPFFVLVGAFVRTEWSRVLYVVALAVLVLGTSASLVAKMSGEAGRKSAERDPRVKVVLDKHNELGETTVSVFAGLAVLLGGIVMAPRFLKKVPPLVLARGLPVVFLAVYGCSLLLLVNTAYTGVRLVHEYGVHAPIGAPQPAAAGTPVGQEKTK